MSEYSFERTIVEHPTQEELVTAPPTGKVFVSGTDSFVVMPSIEIPKNDMDCVCENCGCDKIQEKYWVEVNSKKLMDYVDDCDDYPNYCPDCGDNVCAIYRKDFDYDDEEEQTGVLAIGDKVKIAKSSDFYDEDTIRNPRNEVGKVVRLMTKEHPDLPYEVKWKGGTNNYARKDLIKVNEF